MNGRPYNWLGITGQVENELPYRHKLQIQCININKMDIHDANEWYGLFDHLMVKISFDVKGT